MRQVYVSLPTTAQVQRFVGTLAGLKGEFELISGPYVLDARSLMGVFGLDLTRPVLLKIYHDSGETLDAISPYLSEKEAPDHE